MRLLFHGSTVVRLAMGKSSSETKAVANDEETAESARPEYEELIKRVGVYAMPMANKKLTKKIHKTVKKAAKTKCLRRGVKEVAKALRKKESGIVIIAGDVSPIDVIAHLPVSCESNGTPYCYVPSRMDLGLASQTKRPTSVVLIKTNEDYKDYYSSCATEIKAMPLPI